MSHADGPTFLAAWHVPADAPFTIDALGRVVWKTAEADVTQSDRLFAGVFAFFPDDGTCPFCGFELEPDPFDPDGCGNFDCPSGTAVD
jgi:hypothetical protein